jgi:hypothetical protein
MSNSQEYRLMGANSRKKEVPQFSLLDCLLSIYKGCSDLQKENYITRRAREMLVESGSKTSILRLRQNDTERDVRLKIFS